MAKTIGEWKTEFEVLFWDMCKDLDVKPTTLSVSVSCSNSLTDEFGRPLTPKVKAKITLD